MRSIEGLETMRLLHLQRAKRFALAAVPIAFVVVAVLLSGLLVSGNAWAASLTAEVKKQTIVDGETVLLYVIGEDLREYPDTSALNKRFDIVGSRRQESQFVDNGVVKSRFTILLELQPKHLGVSEIPPFEADGQRSDAISIEVVQRGTPGVVPRDNVFAELSVDNASPYVQAQAILSLHVLDDGSLAAAEPEVPDIAEMHVEQIPGDAQRLETRDGVEYRVHTWRYALFPQRSGTYDIPRIKVVANVKDASYGGNLILRNSPTRRINFRSDSIQLQVKPRPSQNISGWWLPVKQLDLQKNWSADPGISQVGEPLTYSVVLTTSGATSTQLPEIKLPPVDGLKIYPDVPELASQPGDDGVVSRRTDKWSIIPQRAGKITLPEYKLRWWDTVADRERTTIIPAQELTVAASAADSSALVVDRSDTEPKQAEESSIPEPQVSSLSSQLSSQLVPARNNLWAWVAAAVSMGWIATLVAWLFSARRNRKRLQASLAGASDDGSPHSISESQAMRDLTLLSSGADRPRYLAGLMSWSAAEWPDRPPVSVVDVGRRLRSSDLSIQLQQLESSIYSAQPSEIPLSTVHKILGDAIAQYRESKFAKSTRAVADDLLPKL